MGFLGGKRLKKVVWRCWSDGGDGEGRSGGIWGENGGEMVEKWVAKGGRRKSLAAGCWQPWLSVGREEENKIMKEREGGKMGWLYKGVRKYYNIMLTFQIKRTHKRILRFPLQNAAHILAFRPKWAKRGN